jgi:hypothetical protein
MYIDHIYNNILKHILKSDELIEYIKKEISKIINFYEFMGHINYEQKNKLLEKSYNSIEIK